MKHVQTSLLDVFYDGGERRKLGRLAVKGRQILFEYDPGFVSSRLEISPFLLPLRTGVAAEQSGVFDGLFGVFNDSLPDGWGRLLLDRAVEGVGIPRQQLTPLDRLAHVGRHGMGALSYEPDLSEAGREPKTLQLDELARDAATVLTGQEGPVIEKLLKLNGGSGGARPKVVAQVSADRKKIVHGQAKLLPDYSHWMIKFQAINDPGDVGVVEYAYSRMAKAAGIDMPETHLFGGRKKYFGIKRFDREGDRRIHMHTLSGLIHANHTTPNLDYDAFLKVTLLLTKDVTEVEKAFRLACFNVLAHNRDDHSKNVSYLLDEKTGAWTLAPAYDLTFSSGPGGWQSMTVLGEGKVPDATHLRKLGDKHGLRNARLIIDEVQTAIANWSSIAKNAGVTGKAAKLIAGSIAPARSKSAPAAKAKAPAAKTSPARKPAKKNPTPQEAGARKRK